MDVVIQIQKNKKQHTGYIYIYIYQLNRNYIEETGQPYIYMQLKTYYICIYPRQHLSLYLFFFFIYTKNRRDYPFFF